MTVRGHHGCNGLRIANIWSIWKLERTERNIIQQLPDMDALRASITQHSSRLPNPHLNQYRYWENQIHHRTTLLQTTTSPPTRYYQPHKRYFPTSKPPSKPPKRGPNPISTTTNTSKHPISTPSFPACVKRPASRVWAAHPSTSPVPPSYPHPPQPSISPTASPFSPSKQPSSTISSMPPVDPPTPASDGRSPPSRNPAEQPSTKHE
mmetsp:Transcript_12572/g.15291  ORF Transcript_12572/g.15291 Transcript_12572/m.15291 type:complete len:207 (+) Transcript_12572:290-910(+)